MAAHLPNLAKTVPYAKVAKPLLSTSSNEARRRVLNLYRAWWREAPTACEGHALDMPLTEVRAKIREMFEKNRHVQDIRMIDMMVVKGTLELEETTKGWKQYNHVMQYFDSSKDEPKQKDFLTKFYEGYD